MSAPLLDRIDAELARAEEADDALRAVVALLASGDDVAWAGIAFVEEGELVLGPSAGTADAARRTRTPVVFQGAPVGELWVDGDVDPALLDQVAERLSAYVLLGWDTSGATWEP